MDIVSFRKIILIATVFAAGCSHQSTDPVVYTQAIAMTVRNLPESRTGETYALWMGFPGSTAHSQKNSPQHSGSTKYSLVSRFTIDSSGKIVGFDTSKLSSRLRYSLALAEQADISVELASSVNDTLPAAILMVSDFSGSAHQGVAALKVSDDAALGYDFSTLTGAYTLTPPVGNDSVNGTDIYLMNATSASNTSPSLQNLPSLNRPWRYALWIADTISSGPWVHFYGSFISASGFDADSANDYFPFPGGRVPRDTTKGAFNLRASGKAQVLVTLEPGTFGPGDLYTRPPGPFGVWLLRGTIPTNQPYFSPVGLTNVAASTPTATVIINR